MSINGDCGRSPETINTLWEIGNKRPIFQYKFLGCAYTKVFTQPHIHQVWWCSVWLAASVRKGRRKKVAICARAMYYRIQPLHHNAVEAKRSLLLYIPPGRLSTQTRPAHDSNLSSFPFLGMSVWGRAGSAATGSDRWRAESRWRVRVWCHGLVSSHAWVQAVALVYNWDKQPYTF